MMEGGTISGAANLTIAPRVFMVSVKFREPSPLRICFVLWCPLEDILKGHSLAGLFSKYQIPAKLKFHA